MRRDSLHFKGMKTKRQQPLHIGKKLTLVILKYYLRFAPPNNDPKTPRMSCLPTSWPMLRAALLAADSNTP